MSGALNEGIAGVNAFARKGSVRAQSPPNLHALSTPPPSIAAAACAPCSHALVQLQDQLTETSKNRSFMPSYRTSEVANLPDFIRDASGAAERHPERPTLREVLPATESLPLSSNKGVSPGRYYRGPAILDAGARVGILCDTLHGDREVGLDYDSGLRTGAELIQALGYEPIIDVAHASVAPYFARWAGDIQQRVEHITRLLDEYRVDAIFPLFGKGGGHGVLDALAASHYRPSRPVVLIGGFSHHTDLCLFGQGDAGRGFFSHQINATQCAYWKILPHANIENLRTVLHGAASVEYVGLRQLNGDRAPVHRPIHGVLSGGNMGAVLRNARKSWMVDLRDKIVMCEDYDRHPHDVHRSFDAFTRLANRAGAAAIVIGAMLPMKRAAHARLEPEQRELEQRRERAELRSILSEVADRSGIPVFQHDGLCGHGAMNYPLGFGGHARISPEGDGSARLFNELAVQS
jgi:muramoyltetrapeptide carboxypeptidase LdcA involved in peptidoglycan recycling